MAFYLGFHKLLLERANNTYAPYRSSDVSILAVLTTNLHLEFTTLIRTYVGRLMITEGLHNSFEGANVMVAEY